MEYYWIYNFLSLEQYSWWNNKNVKTEEIYLKENYFTLNINLNHNWNYYTILKRVRYLT